MIELKPIENSSQIDATGYDIGTQTLAVRFKAGGNVYHYLNVPAEVAQGMVQAESPGRYLLANIKHEYSFERIDQEGES